ncbi:MAG: CopD family protein [Verrucomicrobia bacterium]|nr:CopD family protein [Verrucomicrobiota bacterium]
MLWLPLARAIHIAASILLAAIFAFRLVVLAPVVSRPASAGYGATGYDRVDRFQPRFKGIWGHLALVAWSTMVVSAVVWFWVVAATISGAATMLAVDGETLQTVLLQTQFGHLWAGRLACCLILGILLFSGSHELIIAFLSFAVLASLAGSGHSGALVANAGLLPLAGDIAHLIAAAFWPGGLVPLLVLLVGQYRSGDQSNRMFLTDVVRRFSGLSLVIVALLVATGLLNTYFIVGSLGALFTTDYGRLLLFKIALFFLMLALGALNLFVLKPRLCHAAMDETQAAGAVMMPMQSLIRSVACETLLATGVVWVIGFLGATPPPMH